MKAAAHHEAGPLSEAELQRHKKVQTVCRVFYQRGEEIKNVVMLK